MDEAKQRLIRLAQKAHAGERAAALAYRGHIRALTRPEEIAAVKRIENDEWRHRRQLSRILAAFGCRPLALRELVFKAVGTFIALGCRFCGRFQATYFAGVLESVNVCEYKEAARLAETLELAELADEFREMERTEAEHERVLKEMIDGHPLLLFFAAVFGWGKSVEASKKIALN
ncbi:MAG: ferritin-like domain-containing protein [Acidobacteria bacterium]|nr:ferritin-like domain-containing protein [Acidobacteriota bacterium]